MSSFDERQSEVGVALRHNLSVLAECFQSSAISQARIELTGAHGNGGVSSVYYEGIEPGAGEAHIHDLWRVEGFQDVLWKGSGSRRVNCRPMSIATAVNMCALLVVNADHPDWHEDLGAKATVVIDRNGVADLDMYQRTYKHVGAEYEAEPSPLDAAAEADAPSL